MLRELVSILRASGPLGQIGENFSAMADLMLDELDEDDASTSRAEANPDR